MNAPESVPNLVIFLTLGLGGVAALVSLWRLRCDDAAKAKNQNDHEDAN